MRSSRETAARGKTRPAGNSAPAPGRHPIAAQKEENPMDPEMTKGWITIGSLILICFMVLAVLMPWYVYRGAQYLRLILKEIREMRRDAGK